MTSGESTAKRLWTRVGVKAVILREGRLLLLHRNRDLDIWPGLWDLPGGGVEQGESLTEALQREVLEETRFRVTVGEPLHVALRSIRPKGETPFPSVVTCFRCALGSRVDPRLDPSEHSEFLWATAREVGDLEVVPPLKPVIESAFSKRYVARRNPQRTTRRGAPVR